MNKVIDRKESTQIVSSKYFTSKSVMDDSLSDFQEPKKLAGPKVASRKTKSEKTKKATKRIRGQKDIRTALRSKRNELESYSKDFDKVCKDAGLDVDSEQLQLAIALSRSLQQSASTSSESPETSQSLNTQDRAGKIRTTLLEYGFKVPEIKIKATSQRRLKKRKNYKLLLTSEETKKQIISEKYTQVLFQNIYPLKGVENTEKNVTHIELYHLATSATYSVLKNINTFYVDGLVEKSMSTGNLLRDWSEIPGRPVSPKLCEPISMNCSEIECSQDELDIVLSGSLKSCKNIIRSKEKLISVSEHNIMDYKKPVSSDNVDNTVIVLIDDEYPKYDGSETLKAKELNIMDPKNHEHKNKTAGTNNYDTIDLIKSVKNQHRSCSPDLFDDEPSTISDNTQAILSQEEKSLPLEHSPVSADNDNLKELKKSKTVEGNFCNHYLQLSQNTNGTIRHNDFMEITKCVEVQYLGINSPYKTLISQNLTKRKSNDYMEITDCVAKQSIPVEVDIDLTQIPDNASSTSIVNAIVKDEGNDELLINKSRINHKPEKSQTIIDKEKENENNSKNPSCEKLLKVTGVIKETNIDLTEGPEVVDDNAENLAGKSVESLDLTQSSNTSDELPFVSLKGNTNNQPVNDTIIMNLKQYENFYKSTDALDNDEYLDLTQNTTREEINHNLQEAQSNINDLDSTQKVLNQEQMLDLTQEILISSGHNNRTSEINVSFFDEYIHNHSDNNDSKINISPVIDKEIESLNSNVSQNSKAILTAKHNISDDIDLTQDSESSEELIQDVQNECSLKSKENSVESAIIEKEINEGSQSEIDLTQKSDSGEVSQDSRYRYYTKDHSKNIEREVDSDSTIEMVIGRDDTSQVVIIDSSQTCSRLGKKDDVSIDYDEVYDSLVNKYSNSQQSTNFSKSAADINLFNVSNKRKDLSNCSQNSEIFVISDNELDYSMHQSKLERPVENFMFGGLSIMDELSGLSSFRRSPNIENHSAAANQNDTTNNVIEIEDYIQNENKTPVKHKRVNELATPQIPSCSGINTVVTPSNNEYIIKTNNVTPMPKYESMSLSDLHSELDKFGVKPFKRKRAIQLLTHIYNQTHPTIEPYSDDESPCKRRKIDHYTSPRNDSPRKLTSRKILSPKKYKSPKKISKSKNSPKKVTERKGNTKEKVEDCKESNERLINIEVIQSSNIYVVNETPVIKEVECSPEDWVFQKREKAKVHSCRVPLHIAFHNYVLSRRGLREAILCYEPINIDDIHKDLVTYGHRYDPKDLLKFMDKKCITVKTVDNDARNNKR